MASATPGVFRHDASEASVKTSGCVRVSAMEGLRVGVLGGQGIAIASEWVFAPELASGAVRTVLSDWTLPPVDLWAVTAMGHTTSPKARAFAAFVEAECKNPFWPGITKMKPAGLPRIGAVA